MVKRVSELGEHLDACFNGYAFNDVDAAAIEAAMRLQCANGLQPHYVLLGTKLGVDGYTVGFEVARRFGLIHPNLELPKQPTSVEAGARLAEAADAFTAAHTDIGVTEKGTLAAFATQKRLTLFMMPHHRTKTAAAVYSTMWVGGFIWGQIAGVQRPLGWDKVATEVITGVPA
jgi:hypothetical protein